MLEFVFTQLSGLEMAFYASAVILLLAALVKSYLYLREKILARHLHKTKQIEMLEHAQECRARTEENLSKLTELVSILLESDKHRIKGEIVSAHSKHMREGSITLYQLDYLQLQFKSYKAEGGNSYVESLIEDLEELYRSNKSNA